MSEQVVIVKKILFLKKLNLRPEPRITKSKIKIHKLNNYPRKTKKPSRFRCWACGLNKGELELCRQCNSG